MKNILAILFITLVTGQWANSQDRMIDFETTEIGKPVTTWSEQGVTFELAHSPKKNKSVGRVSFFPHLGTNRKGIVNAMANEAIPIRVSFTKPVENVRLRLWGSTTSSALLEAFDSEGKLIAKDSLAQVPVRQSPEELIPFFELAVNAEGIARIEISGSKPGGFLAVDQIHWLEGRQVEATTSSR